MNEPRAQPDTFDPRDSLDQRIDEALRRRFALPAGLETRAARARPARGARFAPWLALALLGAAAAALLAFMPWSRMRPERARTGPSGLAAGQGARAPLEAEPAFCSLIGPLQDGQPEHDPVHSPDLVRLYRDMDACQRGSSSTACGADDLLAERMGATYGQALVLRPEAAGVLHGPFGSDEWPTAMIMTGTTGDDLTSVLVADRDATLACCLSMSLPESSGLRLFTWPVGDIVLTEITPHAEPRLAPYFE